MILLTGMYMLYALHMVSNVIWPFIQQAGSVREYPKKMITWKIRRMKKLSMTSKDEAVWSFDLYVSSSIVIEASWWIDLVVTDVATAQQCLGCLSLVVRDADLHEVDHFSRFHNRLATFSHKSPYILDKYLRVIRTLFSSSSRRPFNLV